MATVWTRLTRADAPDQRRAIVARLVPSGDVMPDMDAGTLQRYLALYGDADAIEWRYANESAALVPINPVHAQKDAAYVGE